MNIGIVGHGFVGKAVEFGFYGYFGVNGFSCPNNVYIHDKYKESMSMEEMAEQSDIIFMCLPTPYDEDTLKIDLTIYDDTMQNLYPLIKDKGKIVVIKSTVVPGTTQDYQEKYPEVPFVFNPEFLTESNFLMDFVKTDRIVIGASNDWASQTVIMLYRSCPWFTSTPILQMSATAAETVKYQCNTLLAMRIGVSNVFYDLCEKFGVNYDDVKNAVGLDPRITPSHISVTSERGYGGKCFPKDVGAFIGCCKDNDVDCKLLEELNAYNLRIRKVKDWREIAGASVGGRDYKKK